MSLQTVVGVQVEVRVIQRMSKDRKGSRIEFLGFLKFRD